MVYKLFTDIHVYTDSKKIEKLEKLGFTFSHKIYRHSIFSVVEESDINYTIETLEDLQYLIKEFGPVLIDNDSIILYKDDGE